MELRRCAKCLLPETHESILFDAEGVCNICRQHQYKQSCIDWKQRKADLGELIEQYRGKHDYDCIVPFSGGKDSTFTLLYLVKEYRVKPLVVRFDHGFFRPGVNDNAIRTFRRLGVDVHQFTPNWKVIQRLMLNSFLEKGDFCWHCHTGIFSYPLWVAIRQEVPLVFWGEPSAEYTAYYSYEQPEEVDEKRFNRFTNLGITSRDMLVRLEGLVDERDLVPFTFPPLKELRRIGYRSVCLGSFIPWDVKSQVRRIRDELGWTGDDVEGVPPGYEYEKVECALQGVRDYLKHIKRGYSRTTHLTSIDLRNGRIGRAEALDLVRRHEGKRPASLGLFLDIVGLSEEEFLRIALSHTVSPHRFDPSSAPPGPPLHDQDRWPAPCGMSRTDAEAQVVRWRRRTAPPP
jgi:N-acetyl sugar amidotransferase